MCDERDGWCLPGTKDKLRDLMSVMIKKVIKAQSSSKRRRRWDQCSGGSRAPSDRFTNARISPLKPSELPQISKKHRRRALMNAASPERGGGGGEEAAAEQEEQEGEEAREKKEDDDDEEEDEEEEFQPSEGSENEMETEILDYI